MVKIIEQLTTGLYDKSPSSLKKIFANVRPLQILESLHLNSDIGICTTLLFIVVGIFLGWYGANIRMQAFIV